MVIVGVGVVLNIEFVVKCGLRVENGICVDDGFFILDLDILVVGDCCWFFWCG